MSVIAITDVNTLTTAINAATNLTTAQKAQAQSLTYALIQALFQGTVTQPTNGASG